MNLFFLFQLLLIPLQIGFIYFELIEIPLTVVNVVLFAFHRPQVEETMRLEPLLILQDCLVKFGGAFIFEL